ncbi:RimJ/RimL family protein N-acetyltransferase [Pseudonocardia sediminis]|uniref:RimJ/RimL family protein N-acetyltransferase n=1 Tax=Pseudonocardia sediminis TaxID=1397368 RepID=A0A4Q7US85_PSEST|nr:GNAT family N-acetyltransferase [Pseudonocardia sediminis]RZT83824.1 RimJ/RimL family protein N-acetyltransferase [Pseudonocardia sediminis]
MAPDVALADLDESALPDLLAAAVDGAEPAEVMAPLPGEEDWTAAQRAEFRAFHRRRSLDTETPVERTFVVLVDGRAAGAARLEPVDGGVEMGIWLVRQWRGRGIGAQVVHLLGARAGGRALVAETTGGNSAAVGLLRTLGADLSTDGDDVHARLPPR